MLHSQVFPTALRPLRPHQERALEALWASLASGHRRPMLQAPTGFGKTLTAAHIVRRALDKGRGAFGSRQIAWHKARRTG